ncbi:MAG: HD domain-containing protein [Clostridia bacterium]|nr:HD domain-containing protein [Clostridia bacterium]
MTEVNNYKDTYKQLSKNIRRQLEKLDHLDIYTSRHVHSVPQIVGKICNKLGFEKSEKKFYIECAYLHDIGKIFIPSEILQKPGKLTEEEYEVMKTHTTKGEDFCNSIRALDRYSSAAGCHHENSDGSGYPYGITEVPLEAELIKVADIYDALLNKRQYKEKIEITKALEILKETLIDRHLINSNIFEALLEVILEETELTKEEYIYIVRMKQTING